MSYSITPLLLPYKDKNGLHKVCFQVIHNRVKLYPPTEIKIKSTQWKKGQVTDHPHKDKLNHLLKKEYHLLEGLLLEAFKHQSSFTKDELHLILTGKVKQSGLTFYDYAHQLIESLKNKLSDGRIKHYRSIAKKVQLYEDKTLLAHINGQWLQRFENWLRATKIKETTIHCNIKIVKAIVKSADNAGLTEANFKGYKPLKPVTEEQEFLNEDELQAFFAIARAINKPGHKLAAYYFLLSCFTGLRISDAKKFNYKTMVFNDEIILRAQKNSKVVSIPLYSELMEVLDFIQDKPFTLSEDKARQYVKEIASLAGIKKHVKYHSSRHTATSRLIQKGFNAHEVAAIIGDSQAVINKVYAHIDRQNLKNKVKKLLG